MILFAENQSVPVSAALQWVSNPVDELQLLFVATKLNMLLRITFQVILPRLTVSFVHNLLIQPALVLSS